MRKSYRYLMAWFAAAAFAVLIIDAKNTLAAAGEAVKMCMESVIPSLFVFIVLSLYISSQLSGKRLKFMTGIGKVCGVPAGAESILLLGLLGGYPVGAQCVDQASQDQVISKADAKRLLAFCSNAGPAFILGAGSVLFENQVAVWALWGIHMASALTVGGICAVRQSQARRSLPSNPITISQAIEKGVKIMANICAWVILFRILIRFVQRWVLWLLPQDLQVMLTGTMELVNGFHVLSSVGTLGKRFVLAACVLGFGGLCVMMQTVSVTKHTGLGLYIPGKLLQMSLSFLIALPVQSALFPPEERYIPHPAAVLLCLALCVSLCIYLRKEKNGSIPSLSVV